MIPPLPSAHPPPHPTNPRHVSTTLAFNLLLLLLLTTPTYSVPTRLPPPATHATTWSDIPIPYRRIFNITARCPSVLLAPNPSVDALQIATIPLSAIREDFQPCGPHPTDLHPSPPEDANLTLITDATILHPDNLLPPLGLSGLRDALSANQNAATLLNISSRAGANLLVGWHSSARICTANPWFYPNTTLYFFIREDVDYVIPLQRGDVRQRIVVPAGRRALFIVPPTADLCLLVEAGVQGEGRNVTVTTTGGDGGNETVTVALTPAPLPGGASPSPTVVQLPQPPRPSVSTEGEPEASVEAEPSVEAEASVPPVATDDVGDSGGGGSGGGGEVPIGDDEVLEGTGEGGGASVSPDSDEGLGGRGVCFPAAARVLVGGRGVWRRMDEVVVGDKVRVSAGRLLPVVMFTHQLPRVRADFVRVWVRGLPSGRGRCGKVYGACRLTLTAGHYVRLFGGGLRPGGMLSVGDWLVGGIGGVPVRVVGVEKVCAMGLFNPQTGSGDIVVEGVVTSTYTTAVHPVVAHWGVTVWVWLVFERSVLVARWVSAWLKGGVASWLVELLPKGGASVAWA